MLIQSALDQRQIGSISRPGLDGYIFDLSFFCCFFQKGQKTKKGTDLEKKKKKKQELKTNKKRLNGKCSLRGLAAKTPQFPYGLGLP